MRLPHQQQQQRQALLADRCSEDGRLLGSRGGLAQGDDSRDLSRQSSGQLTTYTAEEMDHFPNPSTGPIMSEVCVRVLVSGKGGETCVRALSSRFGSCWC